MRILILSTLMLFGCIQSQTNHALVTKQRADARITLGLGYLEQGNYVKARQNLNKAIEYQPKYYRAQLAFARYLAKVGEDVNANQLYQQAVREHPNNGDVLNNYGTYLCEQGHYQQAEERFLQAIRSPDYYNIGDSYENAAFCALQAQQIDKARLYLQQALLHQPDKPRALLYLAEIEIANFAFVEAQRRLNQYQKWYGANELWLQATHKLNQQRALYAQEQTEIDLRILH